MKPVRFFIDERDHKLAKDAAARRGVAFSELARDALLEKIKRDMVLEQLESLRGELDHLLASVRDEQQRSRRELIEDASRQLELQRKDIAGSLRKQEELTKFFLSEISRRYDSPGAKSGSRGSSVDHDSPPI